MIGIQLLLLLLVTSLSLNAMDYSSVPSDIDREITGYLNSPIAAWNAENDIFKVAWNAKGDLLAYQDGRMCVVKSLQDGASLSKDNNTGTIFSWHPSKNILVLNQFLGSDHIKIKSLEDQTGTPISFNNPWSRALALDPAGERLASVDNKKIIVQDLKTKQTVYKHTYGAGESGSHLAWHPNGRLLVLGERDRQWNWDEWTQSSEFKIEDKIVIRSIDDDTKVAEYRYGEFEINVGWHSNGRLLAGSSAEGVVVLDDDMLIKFDDDPNLIHAFAWHPTQEILATIDDNTVKIWSMKNYKLMKEFDWSNNIFDKIYDIAWSSQGLLAIGGTGKKITIIDPSVSFLLTPSKRAAIKKLRHYCMMQELENHDKDTFYLNHDGHQIYQDLTSEDRATGQEKHCYADEFILFRPQSAAGKDPKDVSLWKLVRKLKSK